MQKYTVAEHIWHCSNYRVAIKNKKKNCHCEKVVCYTIIETAQYGLLPCCKSVSLRNLEKIWCDKLLAHLPTHTVAVPAFLAVVSAAL